MDLINTANAARFLYDTVVRDKTDASPIPFYPQKTFRHETRTENPFPRSSPDRAGMDGGVLLAALKELSGTLCSGIHSCLVITNGKCLFDAAVPGYDTGMPHATFSMCKTVTGLAVGMLIDDGRLSLDDKVYRFFPEYTPNVLQTKLRALTVEHLLSMTSGVTFAEVGAAVETDYAKSFFESAVKFEPGRAFAYNSMNSYILSAIVCRLTGSTLSAFLAERLWGPLDIRDAYWEVCPKGVEKGGWGLYLSPYSMAKLGQLFLDGGVYRGKRIVSEAWIRHMVTPTGLVPEHVGQFDYGRHTWVHRADGSYLFNGMLGQNVWVSPTLRTVVVLTSGETTMFQDGKTLNILLRTLVGRDAVKPRPSSLFTLLALRRVEKHFCRDALWLPRRVDEEEKRGKRGFRLAALLGEHSLPHNNCGLLPLVTRLCQNNHGAGIKRLSVTAEEGHRLCFTFTEGEETLSFSAGHHRYEAGEITVKGEIYRTAAAYAFAEDENRLPILKIALHFPELASVRRLVIRRKGESYTVTLSEAPGFEFVQKLMSAGTGPSSDRPIVEFIKERLNFRFLMMKAEAHFSPTFPLVDEETAQKTKKRKNEKKGEKRKK